MTNARTVEFMGTNEVSWENSEGGRAHDADHYFEAAAYETDVLIRTPTAVHRYWSYAQPEVIQNTSSYYRVTEIGALEITEVTFINESSTASGTPAQHDRRHIQVIKHYAPGAWETVEGQLWEDQHWTSEEPTPIAGS